VRELATASPLPGGAVSVQNAAMPFDSVELVSRESADSAASKPRWWARLAARFRAAVALRAAPEPLDLAVLRVLEEARGLIAEREDWVQGSYETLRGERCAVGAIRLAASFLDYERAGAAAQDILTFIALQRGYRDIEAMNDHSRHEAVLAAFDLAIATARGAAE